jgi:hypothetical protein
VPAQLVTPGPNSGGQLSGYSGLQGLRGQENREVNGPIIVFQLRAIGRAIGRVIGCAIAYAIGCAIVVVCGCAQNTTVLSWR